MSDNKYNPNQNPNQKDRQDQGTRQTPIDRTNQGGHGGADKDLDKSRQDKYQGK